MGIAKYPNVGLEINNNMQIYSRYGKSVEKLVFPPEEYLSAQRGGLVAARIQTSATSGYILFGGGSSDVVDAYKFDSSGVTKVTDTVPALSEPRTGLSVAAVQVSETSGYILFGGGFNDYAPDGGTFSAVVDAYFITPSGITKIANPTALGTARNALAATSIQTSATGGYVLFGGGFAGRISTYPIFCNEVDAYKIDSSGITKMSSPAVLTAARDRLAAASIQISPTSGYILFGGGLSDSDSNSAVVDAYYVTSSEITRITKPAALTTARRNLAAAAIQTSATSGYILFGGGLVDSATNTYTNVVDAYKINSSGVTKVADPSTLSAARSDLAAASIQTSPTSGYILFGGGLGKAGSYSVASAAVDAFYFDKTGITKVANPENLSAARGDLAAASIQTSTNSGSILFGGGSYSAVVDWYRISGSTN